MRSIFTLIFLLLTAALNAQKYSGQWSGAFDAAGDPSTTEYVLEIDVKGNSFEGTSTTYFIISGKRYYTICAIRGTIDPGSKTLVSTEISVVKKNTPEWFRDCFQIHSLTYFRKGDTEELSGTWKAARKEDNCGTGTTKLSRKQLAKNPITAPPPPSNNTVRMNPNVPKPNTKPPVTKQNNTTVKTQPKQNTPPAKTQTKKDTVVKTLPSITKVDNENQTEVKPDMKSNIPAPKLPNGLEKRDNKVYETINIADDEIIVNLYDNAEVDGDIVTLLFNGEVIVSKQTLSDKPITLKLKAIHGKDNTLTMYAENLGRIPPNTAIMRLQNGNNYYKVFVSADNEKNASVIFRLK
jgi:hypothetical protein